MKTPKPKKKRAVKPPTKSKGFRIPVWAIKELEREGRRQRPQRKLHAHCVAKLLAGLIPPTRTKELLEKSREKRVRE